MVSISMHTAPTIYISKRIFDLLVSSLLLFVFSPIFIGFFILILIEHILRGYPLAPLLYHETRWTEGRQFTLFKYNIFKQNVLDDLRAKGIFIHTKDLERRGDLLIIGKLLKQIYLDEIPQLFNVLRGDMSIVGPRPMNNEIHAKLQSEGFHTKDRVLAGMTGYYQAVHKTNQSTGSQEMLDTYYVKYYFENPWYKILFFDIKILYKTILVLIMARGI